MQLRVLNRVYFLTGNFKKSVRVDDLRSTGVVSHTVFSIKILLMMLVQKTWLNSWCMRDEMNQGRESRSLVLNRVAKWTIFVLNRVKVGGLGGRPLPQLPLSIPPPRPLKLRKSNCDLNTSLPPAIFTWCYLPSKCLLTGVNLSRVV